MLIEFWPLRPPAIRWFVSREPNGRCRVLSFMDGLPKLRRAKLEGRMLAFSDRGWGAQAGFMKRVKVQSEHTVYEIKSHQERLLFIRRADVAIAIEGMTKKNTEWSNKELDSVQAALTLIGPVLASKTQGGL